MTDGTGNVTIPIGDTDATIEFFETVDPIVDAWFKYRGRVSPRRFRNIVKMRMRNLYRACKLDPAWYNPILSKFDDAACKRYVEEALQPGYRLMVPNDQHFGQLGEESGPFDR
jgi:hypothetical protein